MIDAGLCPCGGTNERALSGFARNRTEMRIRMKKIITLLLCTCMFAFVLTGCTSFKSYTYNVDTGDQIELRLDTTGGYDISSDLPFTISKDGETLSQGSFIVGEGYDYYEAAIGSDSAAEVIEEKSRNGLEYIFYSYDGASGMEYNYVIKIVGSDTALLIANTVSEESARECFERLTISKK